MRAQAIKKIIGLLRLYVPVYVMFVGSIKETVIIITFFLIQDVFRYPHGKNDSCQSSLHQVHQAKQRKGT